MPTGEDLQGGAHTERELKYSVLDPRVPSMEELVAALSPLRVEALPEHTVHDVYLDDDAGSLRGAAAALRRRRIGGRAWAGLKSQGARAGALHQREEIEAPLPSTDADAPWPDVVLRRLATLVDADALSPRVELETVRVPFRISDGGTPLATLSFDAVTARSPGSERSALFDEVEVEALADGVSRADLERIADAVDGLVRLTVNPVSKLERAEALLLLARW